MIQFARGTSSVAASSNSILSAGQPFFETDTNKLKIGNGTASYNDLPYIGGSGGKKYATVVVGTSTAGYTADQVDFLCDGVNDEIEIQAAIDSLASIGGCIKFTSGQFNLDSGPVTITDIPVSIVGEGFGVTVLNCSGADSSRTIYFDCADPCEIRDLCVLSNRGDISKGAIQSSSKYFKVHDCMFKMTADGATGLYISGDYSTVFNCIFEATNYQGGSYSTGFDAAGGYMKVYDCVFGANLVPYNTSWSANSHMMVHNNYFLGNPGEASKYGILLGNIYSSNEFPSFGLSLDPNCICVGNTFDYPVTTGYTDILLNMNEKSIVSSNIMIGGNTGVVGTNDTIVTCNLLEGSAYPISYTFGDTHWIVANNRMDGQAPRDSSEDNNFVSSGNVAIAYQ